MCGIVGFLAAARHTGADEMAAVATSMAAALRHRGPDDAGAWVDAEAGVAFGHRRLSIIDLSAAGHQPMASRCGRYVISYNGEIYNFRSLRRDLERAGHAFRSESDTEVMLAAFTEWGLAGSLPRLNGMFAIAVWDRRERMLTLVRDRLGQKPLYYGMAGGDVVFASELQALHRHPGFVPEIDRNAVTLLLRRGCIAAPYSIFVGIRKLLPGHSVSLRQGTAGQDAEPVPYWSLNEVMEGAQAHPFTGTPEEGVAEMEALLRDAVQLCMVSDVPLGASLSGGVDSSLVVALMQAQSDRPVRTFTMGFRDRDHDEAPRAARVAAHLGTEHTEMYVTDRDALDVIARLPQIYDEPFADASQIPTVLLSELTRRHVTVALSGDGGDELFGGYPKYRRYERLLPLTRLPAVVRRSLTSGLRLAAGACPAASLRARFARGAGLLQGATSPGDLYVHVASVWKDPAAVVPGANEPPTYLTQPGRWPRLHEPVRRAMAVDACTYLPDDVLVKVDRAAMSASLETRIPLLDHRVVELAARMPLAMTYRAGRGKLLLRSVLDRYVPAELVERPKMGFDVPLAFWLRGPLRDWASDLLDEHTLKHGGVLDPVPVRRLLAEHLAGSTDWSGYLWPCLMFQAWHRLA